MLHLLCEGSSIRAIERITGTEKKTVMRLLVQVGEGYNLVKMHSSIRMTPAMKAGVTARPWSLADLVGAAMAA